MCLEDLHSSTHLTSNILNKLKSLCVVVILGEPAPVPSLMQRNTKHCAIIPVTSLDPVYCLYCCHIHIILQSQIHTVSVQVFLMCFAVTEKPTEVICEKHHIYTTLYVHYCSWKPAQGIFIH